MRISVSQGTVYRVEQKVFCGPDCALASRQLQACGAPCAHQSRAGPLNGPQKQGSGSPPWRAFSCHLLWYSEGGESSRSLALN